MSKRRVILNALATLESRRKGLSFLYKNLIYFALIMWHLLADVHFDIKTLPRLQSFFNFYLERFEQTRPHHVIFLGDTFNVRNGTDTHLHRVFSDYLLWMLDAPQSPQIHLLVGNHDMKNRYNRTDNALYPFSLVRNRIKVYQEITRADLDGHKAVFIPYHHNEAQVARYIRTQPFDEIQSTIAFSHGSFRGAIRNGASDSSHDVCHDSVMNRTNLGRYHRAFLGHFHTHGSLSQCSNVTYVGSPIQSNMGDAGDLERGYVEYDPKADTWNLVVNPEAEYYLTMSWAESVESPHRVRGKKIRVTLETTDQAEGAWTDEAVERHVVNLYSHGAAHVDLRRAPQLKDISEPLLEAGEVMAARNELMEQKLHDDALPSMENLVQSFLRAERTVSDSADIRDTHSLTSNREDYLLRIIHDHQQQHGVATPATTFHADLLCIEMCNFRGVSGNTSFNLEALSRGTVFLVASSNGNGKSTLLEAIFWCLYGKFLDPDVNAEEAIHTGKRSCSVALYFRNGYTFTRSRAGKRPKFEISHCGRVVEQGHDAGTTTQHLESHLLHMTSETFRRTIVIADHASSAFLAVRDAQRAQSLDIMFGLDVLRKYRSRLEEESKETKSRWKEVQADCDEANKSLTRLESLRQKCSSELDDCKLTIECKKTAIQTERRRSEEIQGQLQQKEDSIPKRRRTMEIVKGKIAQLRHQAKLYQTMESVRSAQAKVERYRAALAREEEKQERPWIQVYSFVYRLSQNYLIPLISTISYAGAQLPWLNRLLAPVVQGSLTRLTLWASPPATALSRDGLRRLMEKLQNTEALLHVLTEKTSPRLLKPSLKHKEAYLQDTHGDEEEQTADLCSANDCVFRSMDELQIFQLGQQTEGFLQLAIEKHMRIQASLTGDEKDHLAMSQQVQQLSCKISRQEGQLEQMIQQENSHSQKADQLTQEHKDLLLCQESSTTERTKVETKRALETFWLDQLQDAATQKGPFITYCRARYVRSLNALIAQVLEELNQDIEGIVTQHLDFQLQPDYTLEPIHGAPSMGKRSKGQKTRTYLALFLAMFQHTRSRLPFRTSFVFLDEVMDTLDLQGIESLQQWLQRYVEVRGMQAFLMTHRETSLLGKVIEVVRDRKGGTVYKLRQGETASFIPKLRT